MHALVPTDGSTSARAALEVAAGLLKSALLDRVTLLTVTQPRASAVLQADALLIPQGTWDQLEAAADAAAEEVLQSALAGLATFGACVATERRRGDRVQQIVAAAQEADADLIVIGSGGWRWRSLWARLFGSLADAVVRAAHCPVLVVGPSDTLLLTAAIHSVGDPELRFALAATSLGPHNTPAFAVEESMREKVLR